MIEYITYKGKTYPIRISYYALKKFQQETGKDIESVDADLGLLEVLLWYALVAGHKADDKVMTFDREECEFMLDESMNDFLNVMGKFFPEDTGAAKVKKKKS